MPSFATFTVSRVLEERPGLQRVELHDASRAYALTELTGPVAAGDDVVVNTTAVDLDLGTGGWHVVHWNLTRREWRGERGGEVMKLRYTSLQAATGAGVERHHIDQTKLVGVPVVAITLHSQLAGAVAGIALRDPALRVVFVMTGGGALPLALSDLVHTLRDAHLLAGTVTAGHAFGGDLEAVGLADALCLATATLLADVVVTGPGPGLVGTGTELATTALDAVPALDMATALDASPVLCVRASGEDGRPRHRGISHHTRTVAALLRSPVDVVVPPSLEQAAASIGSARQGLLPHRLVVHPDPGAVAFLHDRGIAVATMGRDAHADPLLLPAAAAAGSHGAALAARPGHR